MPSVNPGAWVYLDGFSQSSGSYGLEVCCNKTGETVVLTAAHAIGSMSPGHGRNDRVKFGTGGQSGGSHDGILGTVLRSAPASPSNTLTVDAALVSPVNNISTSRVVRAGAKTLGTPRDLLAEAPEDYVRVHKRGASTGLTSGYLEPEAVAHVLKDSTHGECNYLDGFLIEGDDGEHFAKGGDSGSVVIDDEDRVVGMVVGVLNETRRAFCVPIVPILEELDIHLLGPK